MDTVANPRNGPVPHKDRELTGRLIVRNGLPVGIRDLTAVSATREGAEYDLVRDDLVPGEERSISVKTGRYMFFATTRTGRVHHSDLVEVDARSAARWEIYGSRRVIGRERSETSPDT